MQNYHPGRPQLFHKSPEMIVFCHKWLHQFDQEENNYKIKIVRRACVFCDRVKYCSLERFLCPQMIPASLPSIYNCSIKIITLLPIGWILFHRSYRIKFYHFTVVSFVSHVFPVIFPLWNICASFKAGNGQMWTNLPRLGLSDKNDFFLRRSLNCELKMAVFRGKVLAAQFVNAFTWQFIRDTPATDTGGQKHGNILTTAKYLRISKTI